jgi:hypothetical protein
MPPSVELLMYALPRWLDRYVQSLGEIPADVSRWATTLDDQTYLQIMLFGTLVLTAVVLRALR